VIDYKAHPWLKAVRDSKLVPAELREELAPEIECWARACAIGVATVEEIDRINIYHASHLAMRRAVAALTLPPERVLIDGNAIPKRFPWPATPVVKGDQQCLSVAAASIIAKVWRDRKMAELAAKFPGYGFAEHKGYATPAHTEALRSLGRCEIHRRSFTSIADPDLGQLEFF
jgi:ribonuclease HII